MNLLKHKQPELTDLIDKFLRDIYVDDLTSSVDNVDEGVTYYNFAKNSMKSAGLDLRKWVTNSPEL